MFAERERDYPRARLVWLERIAAAAACLMPSSPRTVRVDSLEISSATPCIFVPDQRTWLICRPARPRGDRPFAKAPERARSLYLGLSSRLGDVWVYKARPGWVELNAETLHCRMRREFTPIVARSMNCIFQGQASFAARRCLLRFDLSLTRAECFSLVYFGCLGLRGRLHADRLCSAVLSFIANLLCCVFVFIFPVWSLFLESKQSLFSSICLLFSTIQSHSYPAITARLYRRK